MSAPRPRIEVITGVERRRRWSCHQKRAIVEESLAPHASATAIARRHGIGPRSGPMQRQAVSAPGTGQLYTWRRQLLKRQLVGTPRFARVEVAVEPPRLTGPIAGPVTAAAGTIEITLADGTLVRVNADVGEPALRRVLGVLRG